MRILVIGQCTLHWGRMEFGNIGNYYIAEPFFRELQRVFPGAEVRTTLQMSDDFCVREDITRLPMELYYGWTERDLPTVLEEIGSARIYGDTGQLPLRTPFINEVLASDLVVDFSGDMWGDNANFLGADRFLVGAYKDLVAKLLNKPVAMIAGSPGPFDEPGNLEIARAIYPHFDLVTHREGVTAGVLEQYGLKAVDERSLACPAFLFEAAPESVVREHWKTIESRAGGRPLVGLALCGWNFAHGPFDRWPRDDAEYELFVRLVNHIVQTHGASVLLISHANGFKVPPQPFELIHGRDYPILKQLQGLLENTPAAPHVQALDAILTPAETKAVLRRLSMLVSGRVHGAVAAMSELVPTVIVDYAVEPKAHKLQGFARLAGMEGFLASPTDATDLITKVDLCWNQRAQVRRALAEAIPGVQAMARESFDALRTLVAP